MDIPPIHACNALTEKNQILQEKYSKLTRKYKKLQKEVLDVQEKYMRLQIERDQTVPSQNIARKPIPFKTEPPEENKELQIEKLLTMHNKLLRQFEKETKQNNNQVKKIRRLEAENEKLNCNIFNMQQQLDYLTKKLTEKENQLQLAVSQGRSLSQKESSDAVSSLKMENQKLKQLVKKLKDELKGLDQSFFDEIEDMKYALQQSAKLNTEYEKAIRRLCKQFGLNYETAFSFILNKKDRKSVS